jgi:hypothetical protein
LKIEAKRYAMERKASKRIAAVLGQGRRSLAPGFSRVNPTFDNHHRAEARC